MNFSLTFLGRPTKLQRIKFFQRKSQQHFHLRKYEFDVHNINIAFIQHFHSDTRPIDIKSLNLMKILSFIVDILLLFNIALHHQAKTFNSFFDYFPYRTRKKHQKENLAPAKHASSVIVVNVVLKIITFMVSDSIR